MHPRLPLSKTARAGGATFPSDFVSGGRGPATAKDESDEAEDQGSDRSPKGDDEDEDRLAGSEHKPTGTHGYGYNAQFEQYNDNRSFNSSSCSVPGTPQANTIFVGNAPGGILASLNEVDPNSPEEAHEERLNCSDLLKHLTISRDQTEASNFETERLLAIFDREFEEKTITPPQPPPARVNLALQDYQMQLMLLEQQNKKRILMAGLEQDSMAQGISKVSSPNNSSPSGRNSHIGFSPPSHTRSEARAEPLVHLVPQPTDPPLQLANPGSLFEQLSELPALNKGPTPESKLIMRLLKQIEDLGRANNTLKHMSKHESRLSRFLELHVLDDDSPTHCLQAPTWTFGKHSRLQLKAESPLIDLQTYLRRNDDISFLVYKWYITPSFSNTDLAERIETGVIPAPASSEEYIEIRSEELRVALELFLRLSTSAEEQHHFSMDKIQAPYLFWYHDRSKRQAFSELLPRHRDHLKVLVDWIESNYAKKYDQFDEMRSRGRISQTFMKYLFYAGDVVVLKDSGRTKACLLQGVPSLAESFGRDHDSHALDNPSRQKSTGSGKSSTQQAWRWNVSCWTIVYDGQFYRHNIDVKLELIAESHDQEVDISKLNVVPLHFVAEDVRQLLRQRGRTFWSCRIRRPVSYLGEDEGQPHTDAERYVIDYKSYKKLHVDAQKAKHSTVNVERERVLVEEMDNDEPPPAPYIYLFPPKISGFSLRRKIWTDVVVDRITDIKWNKDAFKHLVADDKKKELVQALVADRIASERNTDIIQGKGNGLIILLHGGPGTGKTFTAESVAELAEKPLYPVTCGDIGTEPEQVEKYLESVLYLGNLWDCVVLLDEADVFLEERGIADLARNALVSVFLRVLEYYDGILILTSNRVGTFDEAFKSRISLALHYPNFTKSERCRIWKNFLNRLRALKESGIDFDDIECNILELADQELNGRQIRNAITIGRQLAKFQKRDLSYAHLKHVVEVAGDFEAYVKKTKQDLSDNQVARLNSIRYD